MKFIATFMTGADELQRLRVHAALFAELAWLGLEKPGTALQKLRHVVERAEDVGLVADAALWLKRLDPSAKIGPIPAVLRPFGLEVEGDWRGAAGAWADLGAPFNEAMALSQGDTKARLRAIEIFRKLGATASAEKVGDDMRREGIDQAPAKPRASTMRNQGNRMRFMPQ